MTGYSRHRRTVASAVAFARMLLTDAWAALMVKMVVNSGTKGKRVNVFTLGLGVISVYLIAVTLL